jgi:hypothetical protein
MPRNLRWSEADLQGYLQRQGHPPVASESQEDDVRESVFLGKVRAIAKRYGWLAYHTHDSRRSEEGFPDLVLVRSDGILFVELKTNAGKVTRQQAVWLDMLSHTGRPVEVYTWRPKNWALIEERLTRSTQPN